MSGGNEEFGSAPQEWLSSLEVDERRELILSNLDIVQPRPMPLRIHNLLVAETTALLEKPWFEGLTLAEVVALNAIEGWDWRMLTDYESGRETTPRDLIEYRLANCLWLLNEHGGEDAWDDVVYGTNTVTDQLSIIRRLAGMYELDIEEFWMEHHP